jgi:carbamoyl-phosphate synthase small subunit
MESIRQYKNKQSISAPIRDNKPDPLLVDLLAKERVGVTPTPGMASLAQSAWNAPASVATAA